MDTEFHCIHKKIIFIKTLQKMLKLDLILRYELDRLLSRGKNKKVTGLMKNEIKWKSHNKIC